MLGFGVESPADNNSNKAVKRDVVHQSDVLNLCVLWIGVGVGTKRDDIKMPYVFFSSLDDKQIK